MSGESKPLASSKPWLLGGAWADLSEFDGPPQAFWSQYLQTLGRSLQARRVLLLVSSVGQPWQALAQWPAQAQELAGDGEAMLQLLPRLQPNQPLLEQLPQGSQALGLRFSQAPVGPDQVAAIVMLRAPAFDWPVEPLIAWAALAALLPSQYARQHADRAARAASPPAVALASPGGPEAVDHDATLADQPHAQRLYELFRLSIQLSGHRHFMQLAFDLCNELAARFEADRVSLGWVQDRYVGLTAISHVEKFDPKSTLTRALEGAMEEAADQSGELVYPAPAGSRQVIRAHEAYARMQGVSALASVGLRDANGVKGVLCLEKRQGQWSEAELWELRLVAEACLHPLADLQARDRWWGAKVRAAWRDWRANWKQPRHSAWKLGAMAGAVLLLALVLVPWPYRIDAALTLRSKDLLFMPAPFDGYLRQVNVDIGDKVEPGQILVELDTRDLAIEASMAEADVLRYSREAEKAQAVRQLAEMQINLARQEQSAAKLALIRHQLAHAEVRAPHAGVVVEGELKKNLGAPLKKGDLLLKLAHTEDSYLELEIDQVDVHETAPGSRGEFALVGRPDQKFSIQIERIDPAATLREGRNVYLGRARVSEAIPAWWRPGMGGTARIEAGDRPLIWIMTHRTVRFLREMFWL